MKRWTKALAALVMLAGIIVPATMTQAQDAPKVKEEKSTEAQPDSDSLTVPFDFEGLIFIKVKVNGKGPYKFLFDSGASQSVINDRLAEELKLEKHDMPGGGGVQGVGTAEAKMVVLDNLQIGGYERGKCVAASMNLDHMSGSLGYHMMGIVGQNVIKMIKEIDIDFAASQLTFTKYGEDEMPRDQDEMLIQMLEGGGMPGMPGLPGLPGGPKDEPKKDHKKGDDDEFSTPALPPMGNYFLLQTIGEDEDDNGEAGDEDGEDTDHAEAAKTTGPTESQSLQYTTVSLPMLGDLVPFWYLDVQVNGQDKTFMFDTGASMLLALSTELGNELNCTTSFGYPVKGVGKGDALSTMVESFQVGNLTEEDLPATVMDLPKMSEQLPDMIKTVLKMLGKNGPKLDFDGIVGISLAARYKKLHVNTSTKKIELTPYEKGETNNASPYAGEAFFKDDVIRTWHGKAGKFGLTGDSVPLDEWKENGLESGGMLVDEVEENGAAAKAGIKKGDIITHLVGVAEDVPDDMEDADEVGGDVIVRDLPSLIMTAASMDPGTEITVRIKRGEDTLELKVKLDKYGWEGTIPERWK